MYLYKYLEKAMIFDANMILRIDGRLSVAKLRLLLPMDFFTMRLNIGP